MSYASESSPQSEKNNPGKTPELTGLSLFPFRTDFFQQTENELRSPTLSLHTPLPADEVINIAATLRRVGISVPEIEIIHCSDPITGNHGTTILLSIPRGIHGELFFNPGHLRAAIGRELQESELTTIALVTRSIAREILKVLDSEDEHLSSNQELQSDNIRPILVEISGKLQDFLVSVPHFDPTKYEMVCDATYVGFTHDKFIRDFYTEQQSRVRTSSEAVLSALQELFIDAVCTLYSSTDSKPIRWGNIAADTGVYAIVEGITSACNEVNLLEYSSQVCGFTNDEALLTRVQSELEHRWKRYKIAE